jgi:putrescine importer
MRRHPKVSTPEVRTKIGDPPVPHLRRVLSAWNLVLYGVVAVTPSAPATIYGVADRLSHGHAVVTIMASMVAMVLTAISYGRMAALYPSAGSLYTYVGRGVHPYLGFVAGWAMILEYVATPLFCVMYGTLAITRAVPNLPFPLAAALLAGGITYLNLRGVRSTVRANEVLTFFMFMVLFAYIGFAIRFIFMHQGLGGLFSVKPFYSPGTFSLRAIAGGTSFAAFTFLGFDSVTTLAEDVTNPRRNVMLAAVVVCVFTGIFGGLMVYLAQLAWPDYTSFTNIETAFIEVTGRVGGIALFRAMAILLVIANVGAGMTNQVSAARLMFGMGRDNVIPRRFFAYLNPVSNAPSRNIWLIGALAYFGSLAMSYELTAEIINFGAFLGFIGVNLAVIGQFAIKGTEGYRRRIFADFLLPAAGTIFCTVIFLGLGRPAMIGGGIWLLIGLVVLVRHTSGFRQKLMLPDPATYH